MRHSRLGALVLMLALTALACNLSFNGGGTTRVLPSPTAVATSILMVPTTTVTPFATFGSTLIPTPTAGGATGACTPRTGWPSVIVAEGDTLFVIAQLAGSSVQELVAANCLPDANAITAGMTLYVPRVPPPAPSLTPAPGCSAQWFFSFDEGMFDDRAPCPAPVITLNAVGQNFEGGRVLWYQAMPGYPDQRATVYVIYNDRSWTTFPDTWDSTQPESDLTIAAPPGRFQPVRGIGKVWRDNAEVRSKLGWAYAPEQPFTGHFQEPAPPPPGDPYFYLDHGAWNVVLRLYAVNMGPNRWEVAGHI